MENSRALNRELGDNDVKHILIHCSQIYIRYSVSNGAPINLSLIEDNELTGKLQS